MSDIADLGFTEEAFKSSRNFLNEYQKCHRHTEAVSECYLCNWRYFRDHVTHAISRAEARVAELEAEKQKSAQEWLHLDAANRTLIEENKRMRKYADAMAEGYISLALWAGERCPTTAGMYLKEFPPEEAKHG